MLGDMARKITPKRPAARDKPIHIRVTTATLEALTAMAEAERRPLTQLLAIIADDAVAAWQSLRRDGAKGR
jgi:hypothetical protein